MKFSDFVVGDKVIWTRSTEKSEGLQDEFGEVIQLDKKDQIVFVQFPRLANGVKGFCKEPMMSEEPIEYLGLDK